MKTINLQITTINVIEDRKINLLKSREAVAAALDRAIKSKDSWKVIIENKTLARIDYAIKKLQGS